MIVSADVAQPTAQASPGGGGTGQWRGSVVAHKRAQSSSTEATRVSGPRSVARASAAASARPAAAGGRADVWQDAARADASTSRGSERLTARRYQRWQRAVHAASHEGCAWKRKP